MYGVKHLRQGCRINSPIKIYLLIMIHLLMIYPILFCYLSSSLNGEKFVSSRTVVNPPYLSGYIENFQFLRAAADSYLSVSSYCLYYTCRQQCAFVSD